MRMDLAARIGRGDDAAFAELYDYAAADLFGIALAALANREQAAQAVERALLWAVRVAPALAAHADLTRLVRLNVAGTVGVVGAVGVLPSRTVDMAAPGVALQPALVG